MCLFKDSFIEYGRYLIHEITNPSWNNYFYALLIVSLIVWLLEILFPWRKNQGVFRKDFWLDFFYMFFNFFIFNLIVFIALSRAAEIFFKDILSVFSININSFQIINLNSLPIFTRLLIFFLISDFIQWLTHILLHRINWLWNFHKVHHSVKEMGFAAHLRYHWMETLIYRAVLYIPLAIVGGFNVDDVIFINLIALLIGHLNHANINLNLGYLKYIFNNAYMHIWHHAKHLPSNHRYGVNFAISLSIWDYIFRTNYIPKNGKNIELGFKNDDKFPKDFFNQEIYPFKKYLV